mmetsp:Transcript_12535/g.14386  ORF Transcript_12535/g.14386 Transcript_12535/m.14386 type:complete len:94 (+) Transcript_12535:171-452(+)
MSRCGFALGKTLLQRSSRSRVCIKRNPSCSGKGLESSRFSLRSPSIGGVSPKNPSRIQLAVVGRHFSLSAADIIMKVASGDLILGSNDDDEGT